MAYQNDSIVYHSHYFSMFELYRRTIIEIKFFDNYFNYKLRINFYTAIKKNISDTSRDVRYLINEKSFELRDYFYCFKKNLVAQIAHSKMF